MRKSRPVGLRGCSFQPRCTGGKPPLSSRKRLGGNLRIGKGDVFLASSGENGKSQKVSPEDFDNSKGVLKAGCLPKTFRGEKKEKKAYSAGGFRRENEKTVHKHILVESLRGGDRKTRGKELLPQSLDKRSPRFRKMAKETWKPVGRFWVNDQLRALKCRMKKRLA